MMFEFIKKQNSIQLPYEALDKLNTASETELRVLIYASAAASSDGSFDENDIQKLSGLELTDIIIALQFWRGAGIICKTNSSEKPSLPETKKADAPPIKNDIPHYSGEEISALFESNGELRLLIDECQKLAGKMFNPHEINKIISLYDYLGLSSEYILNVFSYCKNKNKTTVPYVEKTAFNLYDEGVDTDEKLREYLIYRERFDSAAGNIRRIFGIGSRSFTKKEEAFIHKWTEVWKMDMSMIEYAYELTVNATEKASLPYANKILEGWHNSGFTTVEQAREAGFDYKKNKKADDTVTSFDSDEFFEAALKRSYDNIGKKSEG